MLSRLTTERKVFLLFLLTWIFFYFGYWLSIRKLDLIDGFWYNSPEVSLNFVFSTIVSHLFATCAILVFIVLYYFLLAFLLLLLAFVLIPPITLINFIYRKIFNREFDWFDRCFKTVSKCLRLEGFSASTEWRIIFSCLFGAFFVAGISWENSLFWYEGLGDLLPI